MSTTAKNIALQDIKEELKREHKAFVAFRQDLNEPIQSIVHSYLKEQKQKY